MEENQKNESGQQAQGTPAPKRNGGNSSIWLFVSVILIMLTVAVAVVMCNPTGGQLETRRSSFVRDSLYKVVMSKGWEHVTDEFSTSNNTEFYVNYPKNDDQVSAWGRMVMNDSVCDYFNLMVRVPKESRVDGAYQLEFIYGDWKDRVMLNPAMEFREREYTDYRLMEVFSLEILERFRKGVDMKARLRDLRHQEVFTIPAEDLEKVHEMYEVFEEYRNKMDIKLVNEYELLEPSDSEE